MTRRDAIINGTIGALVVAVLAMPGAIYMHSRRPIVTPTVYVTETETVPVPGPTVTVTEHHTEGHTKAVGTTPSPAATPTPVPTATVTQPSAEYLAFLEEQHRLEEQRRQQRHDAYAACIFHSSQENGSRLMGGQETRPHNCGPRPD